MVSRMSFILRCGTVPAGAHEGERMAALTPEQRAEIKIRLVQSSDDPPLFSAETPGGDSTGAGSLA
jgi:hypothetical protein